MKRITKIFVALAMMLSFSNMSMVDVSAAELTSGLDLSNTSADIDGTSDGYYWDYEELTLTVYGLTINTSDVYGIILPDGAKVVLEGNLSVTTTSDVGDPYDPYPTAIYGEGIFSITGTGDIYLSSTEDGIEFNGDSKDETVYIDIVGNIKIDADYGIYDMNSTGLSISLTGDLTINANYWGVYVDGSVGLFVDGDLTIISEDEAIYASDGSVTITVDGEATIDSRYMGIYACHGVTINGTGTMSIISVYESIFAYGPITFEDSITVTTDGTVLSLTSISIGDGVTLNTVVVVEDRSAYHTATVYGYFVAGPNCLYGEGEVLFDDGAVLVVSDGAVVELRDYDIDFSNAQIIVEDGGTILYSSYVDLVEYTSITELTIEDWEYSEVANAPETTAIIIDNDHTYPEYSDEIIYTYYEDEDCTIEVEDITAATAGTYYVKASIATVVDETDGYYVLMGTYAVEEFEILTKYYTVVIDDVEEKVELGTVIEVPTKDGYTFDGWVDEDEEVYTSEITVTSDLNLSTTWTKDVVDSTDGDGDTNADADADLDTDTEVDGVVDTGDTNNVLLFTTLSISAMALILIDMKKRNRV